MCAVHPASVSYKSVKKFQDKDIPTKPRSALDTFLSEKLKGASEKNDKFFDVMAQLRKEFRNLSDKEKVLSLSCQC